MPRLSEQDLLSNVASGPSSDGDIEVRRQIPVEKGLSNALTSSIRMTAWEYSVHTASSQEHPWNIQR
jgi:hypothetical protein